MAFFRSERRTIVRPSVLAVALALGMGATCTVFAQATTGSIFGQAPAAAGESVTVTSDSGFTRDVPVDADGRYRIGNLPLGNYTVSLKRDGAVVDSRKNIQIKVGGASDVSFASAATAANAQSLESVTVSANTLPPIDTSTVDSRTVVNAQTLARLPLGRNAEAIALLAPGAVAGQSTLGNGRFRTVSFGGSGASENAYYVNGYNTTDPYKA
ncbi:MAG: carboxypeptidase regulatory-like domain-containing protein, partial [Luteibacter jiangsuensis]